MSEGLLENFNTRMTDNLNSDLEIFDNRHFSEVFRIYKDMVEGMKTTA